MKGFVIFELAPPWRWVPKYERDQTIKFGKFHRFIWLYFSITFVFNLKLTEFIKILMNPEYTKQVKDDRDPHERHLGI